MAKFSTISTRQGNVTGVFRILGGRVPVTQDYGQIVRQQIVDALVTNAKERVMRPDYGADIQSLLFDGADSLVRADVASTVKERLGILVPRATIKSVTLITEPTELSIRGIDSDGRNVVLIDVLYATRLIEHSLAVVVQNGASSG
jgi:phage baseplate assembly protein W